MSKEYVIGVDAGGTKTTAWLAKRSGNLDDRPLATGGSGPGNLRSTAFDTATANINAAISNVIAHCPGTIHCLCICAAGAGRHDEQQQLQQWAESSKLATHVRITADIDAVLASASADSTGVALIAGTGSLAWGRNSNSETHRAGGWGHLVGDEGSGYDISMNALRQAVRMADGREAETPLLQTLMQQLSLAHPSELVAKIYSEATPKAQIASLAKCIFDAATSGDPVAGGIIDTAANELALMVKTVATHLDLNDNFSLAVTGGVLIQQRTFRHQLLQLLNRSPEECRVVKEPAQGAVALARSMP